MSVSASVNDVWAQFVATRRSDLRDELIVEYAPLVRFVVGRLGIPPTSILDAEDLISYGVIGLINAIDRFDPREGYALRHMQRHVFAERLLISCAP